MFGLLIECGGASTLLHANRLDESMTHALVLLDIATGIATDTVIVITTVIPLFLLYPLTK